MQSRNRTMSVVAVSATAALTFSQGLALAASSDTVTGEVVIAASAEACITIALDGILFGGTGGLEFTPDTGLGADNVQASTSGPYAVENCSTAPSTFSARATAASNSATAAEYWDPYDPFAQTGGAAANVCDHGLDLYRVDVVVTDSEPDAGTFLTLTDRPLNGADGSDPVAAGGTRSVTNTLTMPCVGSMGAAGDNVQFDMIYTATLS